MIIERHASAYTTCAILMLLAAPALTFAAEDDVGAWASFTYAGSFAENTDGTRWLY